MDRRDHLRRSSTFSLLSLFFVFCMRLLSSSTPITRMMLSTPMMRLGKWRSLFGLEDPKEPAELVRLVKKLKHDVATAESNIELSRNVKHKLVDEILERLKSLEEKSNVTLLRGCGRCQGLNLVKRYEHVLLTTAASASKS